MCQIKVINRTSNGFLLYCAAKDFYTLSFNNLTFNFNSTQLESFVDYVNSIDGSYWEKEYANSVYTKKIPIPTQQTNFIILLDRNELEELCFLLEFSENKAFLKSTEINYKVIYN